MFDNHMHPCGDHK
jgi:hypothetical protein